MTDLEKCIEALKKAVEIIKQWHNMPNATGRLHEFEMERMWQIYYNHAPEMKPIREALASLEKDEDEKKYTELDMEKCFSAARAIEREPFTEDCYEHIYESYEGYKSTKK